MQIIIKLNNLYAKSIPLIKNLYVFTNVFSIYDRIGFMNGYIV